MGDSCRLLVSCFKKSACGFLLKDVILECSWMASARLQDRTPKTARIWHYLSKDAWLDTPLSFCMWLFCNREQKRLKRNQKKLEYDRLYRANRWKSCPKYRADAVQRRRKNRHKNKNAFRAYSRNYVRNRKLTDPAYRLSINCRNRFKRVIDQVKAGYNSTHYKEFVGCDSLFLKSHLEKQFEPWMSWHNYGSAWHIDHKKPLSHFNLRDESQARLAFHYSNLSPVSKFYNLSKSNRWSD